MASFNIDSQAALAQIRSLIAEVNNLKTAVKNISISNEDSLDKLEALYNKLKVKTGLLTNKLRHLEAIIKKNTVTTNSNTAATSKNANTVDKNSKSRKKQAAETEKATKAQKKNNKETKKGTKGLMKFSDSIRSVLAAFGLLAGIQILKNIIKDIFQTTKTFDALAFTMNKITGSAFGAADSQRFLLQITKDYGVELVSTTNRWIKFLAAAKQSKLSLKDTEDIFRSMTKAAGVLGLKTEELTGVYLALEQMLSKGKVTTEELRRQLGERLPGAMGIMASAIGVTIPKLDEMLKKGEVLSAEVLPKFAKAVELAYDIENVNTIQTLVAEQNRLTAAWQLFIKTVTDGDSPLRSFFNFLLTGLRGVVEDWTNLLATPEQKMEVMIVEVTKKLTRSLRDSFGKQLGLRKGFVNEEQRLISKAASAKKRLDEATNKEERDEARLQYETFIKLRQDFNEEREALIKEYAKSELLNAKEEYKKSLKAKKDFEEAFLLASAERIKKTKDPLTGLETTTTSKGIDFSLGFPDGSIKSVEEYERRLAELRGTIVDTTAKWALFKKLTEDPGASDTSEELGTPKIQINLRALKDLTLEIQNEILENAIFFNKAIIENEKSSIEERRQALIDWGNNQVAIAENSNAIRLRDIEASYTKEQESLERSVSAGKLSKNKFNDFIVKAEEEKNDKIEISNLELAGKLADINSNIVGFNIKINKNEDDVEIEKIEDEFNRRIIKIKELADETVKANQIILNSDKSTNKERKEAAKNISEAKQKAEKDLKLVSVEMGNAIIDKNIEILESTIKGKDATEEWVQAIIRAINKLKAQKLEVPSPDDDSTDDWIKYWDTILGFAGEFVSEIGNIVDNIFEGRIENINAEIEAERDKYDILIELARDDEEQQQTLRRNKEASIKKLEKKRLKEEQKQAKAKKAFAIADIAISTSQAILGIWAQVPKYDFGISAGLMTAFVSALGAAQIAAVLTQPIPKYKEGGKINKEHMGMINDGMYKEYIERKGEILTTDRKNAIVNLKPGDTIYKNYDQMINKSSLINAMTNSNRINKDKFENLFLGIENSISRGFKKSKINNKIVLRPLQENNSYKEKMSRWN